LPEQLADVRALGSECAGLLFTNKPVDASTAQELMQSRTFDPCPIHCSRDSRFGRRFFFAILV